MTTNTLSRRELLFPTANPSANPSAGPSASPSSNPTSRPAAPTPEPPAQTETANGFEPDRVIPVPSTADRHLLSRFTGGITPSLVRQSADAGGARAWFDAQLEDRTMGADGQDPLNEWWPHLAMKPAEKYDLETRGVLDGYEQGNDFSRWTLMKRIGSPAQVFEVMVDFWSNILYVSNNRKSFPHRPRFDGVIRKYALGTFEDLLREAALDPGMLCFLDNARSTKKAPNENLGRELLELHTLGRDAPYTETDVLNSTRILTGYRVVIGGTCQVYYSPEDHYVGPVRVLDFAHPNDQADGRPVTVAYLKYLAHHVATAQRIARALAVRFVSDTPSQDLVDTVASAFLDSGTNIPTTMRALIDHPDFAGSAGLKIRTPIEDFVNTYRTLQITVKQVTTDETCAASMILACVSTMGQRPFDWPRPDGFPDNGEAWASASRLLGSWRVHKNSAGGLFPKVGVTYQPSSYWLGHMPVLFENLVDRLSRLILAKPSSPRLLATAVKAVGVEANEMISSDHVLVRRRMPLLLLSILDTPDHMTR